MARFRWFLLLAGAILPVSCSEGRLPLNPAPAEPPPDVAAEGTKVNNARHDLAVGARHQKLQVQISAGAQGVAQLPLRPMVAAAGAGTRTTSMCMGQRLPDHGAGVLEFQGCWGGPSASRRRRARRSSTTSRAPST
jgi:hypothetical protein